MPKPVTPSGEQRRSEILDAALRCFNRLGISRTTIDDIRAESGASIGSIYHQFASKDDIVSSLYCQAVSVYHDGLTGALGAHPDPRRAVEAAVDFHVQWIDSHRALARIMLRWDESELSEDGRRMLAKETRRFSVELGRWLKEAVGTGAIRPMSHEVSAALFIGPLLDYGRRMVLTTTARPLTEGCGPLADGIWRALAV